MRTKILILFVLIYNIFGLDDAAIQKIFENDVRCREDKLWMCTDNCLTIARNGTKCSIPASGTSCFGIPIEYNYAGVGQTTSRYGILKRFPKCWEAVAPLLCVTSYRPCALHATNEDEGHSYLVAQRVLAQSQCLHAREECDFIVKQGFFPAINCDDTNPVNDEDENEEELSELFSETCALVTDTLSDTFKKNIAVGQCIWPLVSRNIYSKESVAVFDQCYLPCHHSFIRSGNLLDSYKFLKMCMTGLAVLGIAALLTWYSFKSSLPRMSVTVFLLLLALGSLGIHLVFWFLSTFGAVSDMMECTHDGTARHVASQLEHLDRCSMQSLLLQMTYYVAYFFLLEALYANLRIHNISNKGEMIRIRRNSALRVIVPSSVVSLATFFFKLRENDGVSGLCYPGLSSLSHYILIIAPVVIYTILTAAMVAKELINRKKMLLRRGREVTQNNNTDNVVIEMVNGENFNEPRDELTNEHIRVQRVSNDKNHYEQMYSTSRQCIIWGAIVLHITLGPTLHYIFVNGVSERERQQTIDLAKCILNVSINGGSTYHLRDSFTALADPLDRLIVERFPQECSGYLVNSPPIFYSMLVFFILPTLPFLLACIPIAESLLNFEGSNGYWQSGRRTGCNSQDVERQEMLIPPKVANHENEEVSSDSESASIARNSHNRRNGVEGRNKHRTRRDPTVPREDNSTQVSNPEEIQRENAMLGIVATTNNHVSELTRALATAQNVIGHLSGIYPSNHPLYSQDPVNQQTATAVSSNTQNEQNIYQRTKELDESQQSSVTLLDEARPFANFRFNLRPVREPSQPLVIQELQQRSNREDDEDEEEGADEEDQDEVDDDDQDEEEGVDEDEESTEEETASETEEVVVHIPYKRSKTPPTASSSSDEDDVPSKKVRRYEQVGSTVEELQQPESSGRSNREGSGTVEEYPPPGPSCTSNRYTQREIAAALTDALRAADVGDQARSSELAARLLDILRQGGSIPRSELAGLIPPDPPRSDPLSLDTPIISRLSRQAIEARVRVIRALSRQPLHPLEIFYQLALGDVVWEWTEREVVSGDILYTPAEMQELIGTAPPPPLSDPNFNVNEAMEMFRRRAFTIAIEVAAIYGRGRGAPPRYAPVGAEDIPLNELVDEAALRAAIAGDVNAMRDAIANISPTVRDVMLDRNNPNGAHLRYYRDYLDDRAAQLGFPVGPNVHINHPRRGAPPPPPPEGGNESGIDST